MTVRTIVRSAVAPLYIRARLLQERLQSGVAWYPLDPGFIADPYPTYRKLRERDPYHYSPLMGMLVVSRYEDVDAILRDHQRFGTRSEGGATASRTRASGRSSRPRFCRWTRPTTRASAGW